MNQIRTDRTRSNELEATAEKAVLKVTESVDNPGSPKPVARPEEHTNPDELSSRVVATPDPSELTKPKNRASDKPGAARPAREADIANNLLALERDARQAKSEAELGYLIVNGSRVAVQYRQGMLLMRRGPAKHRVVAVSSLSAVDRTSTFIRWVERNAQI